MMYIGSTDHNFYTKLLGSNGIIGFVAVIIFFCGLIWGNYKNIYGLTVLQSLFCYTFFFFSLQTWSSVNSNDDFLCR